MSSWAPIVGQKRLNSAFAGDTLLNHSRRSLHHGAQVWNSEGNDMRTSDAMTMGGAKRGENWESARGISEWLSSASIIPTKISGQTIAGKCQ